MSRHVKNPVRQRKSNEIDNVSGAFSNIPKSICIGKGCHFFDEDKMECAPTGARVKPEVDNCIESEGPFRRVEKA